MANLYSAAAGGAGTMATLRGESNPNDHDWQNNASSYSRAAVSLRILKAALSHKGLLVVAAAMSVVAGVLQLYFPIIVGRGIDCIIGPHEVDFEGIKAIVLQALVLALVVVVSQWIAQSASSRLAAQLAADTRSQLAQKLHELPLSYHDKHPRGDLLSRAINDVEALADGLLQTITQLFGGIVSIVATIVFMLSLSVPVALVVIVLTPLSIAVAGLIAHFSAHRFDEQQALTGKLSSVLEEGISNHRLMWAFAKHDAFFDEFSHINHELNEVGERAQFISSLTNPSTRLVNNIIYALVTLVGCMSLASGWPSLLSVGQVSSFLSYANQYMRPFNEISSVLTQLQAALSSAARIFDVIDEELPQTTTTQALKKPVCGTIDIQDLHFSYDGVHEVLKGINLHVDSGQRIALVGPTGCGKTTLVSLLMGFYEAGKGNILLDHQNIQELDKAELRASFGMVLQDSWIFEGSVRDNILYGSRDASFEDIVKAAKRAHADAFIEQLPHGYDTAIAADGMGLSTGQRQLICIARVMLQNPAVLLLDEATSSIDARTERLVQDAFDEMMHGRTSLVVAHRLSTIKDADCIVVMDQGSIQELGSYEELLELGGQFAALHKAQFAPSTKQDK